MENSRLSPRYPGGAGAEPARRSPIRIWGRLLCSSTTAAPPIANHPGKRAWEKRYSPGADVVGELLAEDLDPIKPTKLAVLKPATGLADALARITPPTNHLNMGLHELPSGSAR